MSIRICGFANELASDARYEVATVNTQQHNPAQYKQSANKRRRQCSEIHCDAQPDRSSGELISIQLNTATDLGCRVTNRVSVGYVNRNCVGVGCTDKS